MDLASAVVGFLGIIQTFDSALNQYKNLKYALDYGTAYEAARLRLTLARLRLERWGNATGFIEDEKTVRLKMSGITDREVAYIGETLGFIQKLFDALEDRDTKLGQRSSEAMGSGAIDKIVGKFSSRNGKSNSDLNTSPSINSSRISTNTSIKPGFSTAPTLVATEATQINVDTHTDVSAEVFMMSQLRARADERCKAHRKRAPILRLFKWATLDKEKYEDTVEKIVNFITQLVDLFPHTKELQMALACKDAAAIATTFEEGNMLAIAAKKARQVSGKEDRTLAESSGLSDVVDLPDEQLAKAADKLKLALPSRTVLKDVSINQGVRGRVNIGSKYIGYDIGQLPSKHTVIEKIVIGGEGGTNIGDVFTAPPRFYNQNGQTTNMAGVDPSVFMNMGMMGMPGTPWQQISSRTTFMPNTVVRGQNLVTSRADTIMVSDDDSEDSEARTSKIRRR